MHSEDVAIVHVASGRTTMLQQLPPSEAAGKGREEEDDGEDDGLQDAVVSFCLHPNGKELVAASQNLMLRHWSWAPNGASSSGVPARGRRRIRRGGGSAVTMEFSVGTRWCEAFGTPAPSGRGRTPRLLGATPRPSVTSPSHEQTRKRRFRCRSACRMATTINHGRRHGRGGGGMAEEVTDCVILLKFGLSGVRK